MTFQVCLMWFHDQFLFFVILNELLGEEESQRVEGNWSKVFNTIWTWFVQWVRRILRYRPPTGRQAQNDIPVEFLAFWGSYTFFVILNELLGEEESLLRGWKLSSEAVAFSNTIRPRSAQDSSLSLRMTLWKGFCHSERAFGRGRIPTARVKIE